MTGARSCVIVVIALAMGAAHAQRATPPAYQLAARSQGVPESVLFAVALQESGMKVRGRIVPWPWTLNVAGVPSRYPNRIEACSALQRALKQIPATRVDVGLGQINVGYHGHRVRSPCALLDPYMNLATTAAILREQHEPGDDWLGAIGRYHRPAGGAPAARYRRSVREHLVSVLGSNQIHVLLGGTP
jgi:soluble lytic murein transglycosylase-like protein